MAKPLVGCISQIQWSASTIWRKFIDNLAHMESPNQKIAIAGREFGKLVMIVFGGLFAVLLVWANLSTLYREFGTRRIEFITIQMIDTPRTCVSQRSTGRIRIFEGDRQRSSVPRQSFGLYCGYIFTNHGSFLLPESNSWAFWNDTRKSLVDQLKVGCTYEATIVGYYNGFANRQPPINRISNIHSNRDCKPSKAEERSTS